MMVVEPIQTVKKILKKIFFFNFEIFAKKIEFFFEKNVFCQNYQVFN